MPGPTMAYQRFSTADLHPKERLERWIEFGSETLSDMIVVPEDEGGFQASLTRATIGRLGFVWMESTAALATAASKGAGAWAAPTGDAYLLRMQLHGRTIVGNGNETIALRSREMVLRGCDAGWSTRVPHHTGMVTVKIPTDVLLTRIPDPDSVVGHVLSGSGGPAGVAASTILAVKQLLEAPLDEPWEDAVADVLLSSLSLACCAARSAVQRTNLRAAYQETLWQRARHYIEHHLDDPELSVSKVSRENGIGLRTLQRMFLAMGESPRDYISHRRLERAMRLLQARDRNDRLSITNVAFSVGFNDLSHFSRAFAKRYGRSPRNFAAHISDGSSRLNRT